MLVTLLKAKIYNVTITQINESHIGSFTIDEEVLQKSGINENEKIHVINISNGARFESYVMKGIKGSREISANGLAGTLVKKGHKIIIICYCYLDDSQAQRHRPKVIKMDETNGLNSDSGDATLFLN